MSVTTSPICMNGQTTKFTVSRLNAFSSRSSMKFGGANSANILITGPRPPHQFVSPSSSLRSRPRPSVSHGRLPDGHALEVNHFKLVRVVVGDEERPAVGRL